MGLQVAAVFLATPKSCFQLGAREGFLLARVSTSFGRYFRFG